MGKSSKFLQNSKDLLSRSFNPTKCKTSLRLAGSRLKLLRNKKEIQVKQMKREIAQLLETGQDQTARIRVEHVIREEKMMAAYDLLEIYCELVIARLPIIESQKDCPIDLKEAIASIIFSSPRCGDVPELLDVRKHFSSKYGKEFITAAIELRPQCGVGRLLVEKLSATAPDGLTKIKILNTIAEEHNVIWDQKSSEEKVSGGPSSSSKDSILPSESPHVEAADVQVRPNYNIPGSPLNFPQQDDKISSGAEKLSTGQASGVSTELEERPPGENMPQSFLGDGHNIYLDKQKWNMEFKDAASAAQAAAESAERASMAARAAAELSTHGRILTQFSTEPYLPDAYKLKEGLGAPPKSNTSEKYSESSADKSSVHSGLENAQLDGSEPSDQGASSSLEEGGGGPEEYNQSATLEFKASGGADSLNHGISFVSEYTQKNSLEESENEINMKKQSHSDEIETSNGWQEKTDYFGEGKILKQKSLSPSQSFISDDVNIFANFEDQKFENDAGEDPFTGISRTGYDGEAPQTGTHESDALFFDKSDSEVDDNSSDKGPTIDEQNVEFHMPLSGQNSPELLSMNTNSWSPRSGSSNIVNSASPPLFFTRENSSPDFSRNTTRDDTELDTIAPMTFDDSDGPTSESDEDRILNKAEDSRNLQHEHYERGQSVATQLKKEEYSEIDSKQLLLSSDDDEIPLSRNRVNIFHTESSEKLSPERPLFGSENSKKDLMDIGNESSSESEERLNFGKLTGGLRHKRHNHLPFFKNKLDVSSIEKEAETTTTIASSTSLSPFEQPKIATRLEHKERSKLHLKSESDSDISEEEILRHKQVPSAIKPVKMRSNIGAPNSIFDSDDSDLDDYPKQSRTRKSYLQSGISRRTKASSSSGTNSNSGMHQKSEKHDSNGINGKDTTNIFETPKNSEAHKRNSDKTEEQAISGAAVSKLTNSTSWGTSEKTNTGKASYGMKQQPKISEKSSATEEAPIASENPNGMNTIATTSTISENAKKSNPHRWISGESDEKPISGVAFKTTNSTSSGTANESNSSNANEHHNTATVSSSKDEGPKKSSHVHPKLPDYDALVQSLRMNRT